ncbi:MAG: DUF4097 domain-containing protein [Bryobacteraceae bacterium]|nr:DUF4097 domain-containing protein [Bryobacteraceae bacterium]
MRPLILLVALVPGLLAQSKEFQKTAPLDANGRLTIDTYKGEIRVSTWDRAEVEIGARIEDDGNFGLGADRDAVNNTNIEVVVTAGTVRIRTDYSRVRNGPFCVGACSNPLVRYQIRMPRSAHLEIKDYKSITDIDGLRAGLTIDTYKGEVRIRNLQGPLRAKTYKGDIRAALNTLGNTRVETYKGEIELTLPKSAAFTLRADMGRRADLVSDFPAPSRMRRDREQEIRSTVNGGGPELVLKSERGNLRLRAS